MIRPNLGRLIIIQLISLSFWSTNSLCFTHTQNQNLANWRSTCSEYYKHLNANRKRIIRLECIMINRQHQLEWDSIKLAYQVNRRVHKVWYRIQFRMLQWLSIVTFHVTIRTSTCSTSRPYISCSCSYHAGSKSSLQTAFSYSICLRTVRSVIFNRPVWVWSTDRKRARIIIRQCSTAPIHRFHQVNLTHTRWMLEIVLIISSFSFCRLRIWRCCM